MKVPRNEVFVAGQVVSLFDGVELSAATVISVTKGIVVVSRLVSTVPPAYEDAVFLLRSDGLWVGAGSDSGGLSARGVPVTMITADGNMGVVSQWRYHPSVAGVLWRRFVTGGYVYSTGSNDASRRLSGSL